MEVEDFAVFGATDLGTGDKMSEKADTDSKKGTTNGNLPDLVSFEQKTSSDKKEHILANGDGKESSKDDSDAEHKNYSNDQDSPNTDSTKNDSFENSHEKEADDVKENDVKDECLNPHHEGDGWLDILGSGQLKKKVLAAGKDKTRPAMGSVVTVKVNARLDNGVCVQDGSETFILGDGDVISALDMCVAMMNEEETAEIIAAPRFAYGEKGLEPDIPSNATLTMIVQLVDVQPSLDLLKLTTEERLKFGEKKRERGNELFGREDYSGAINSYSKAVKLLDSNQAGGLQGDTSVLQNIVDCKMKCYNNLGASQLKVGAYDAAIRSCEQVLKSQSDNVKAIYRMGKAYNGKGDVDKAVTLLKKALKHDPESKLLHRELSALTQKQKRQSETEKTMYKRMMGNLADAPQKPKADKSSNSMMKWSLIAGAALVTAASVGLAYYKASH